MTQSITDRVAALANSRDAVDLRHVLEAILTDITAIRADNAKSVVDVAMLAGRLDTLATKLNADAGVTDTDYVDTNVATLTGIAPAALTLVK